MQPLLLVDARKAARATSPRLVGSVGE